MTASPCRASPIVRGILRPSLIVAALGVSLSPAQAADLTVVSGPAMARVLADLAPRIEELTGRHFIVDVVPPGATTRRLGDRQPFDVAVVYEPAAVELLKTSQLVSGRLSCIGWTRLGLATSAASRARDIATVADLRRALMVVRSIGYDADGPSGPQFRHVLAQLGLERELGPKLVDVGGRDPLAAVAQGEVELGVAYVGDIAATAGIRALGPLPWQVQQLTPVYAAVASEAADRQAAERLVAFLSSFEAMQTLTAHDLDGTPNE
jgi:ABC-type molybdate transport system substrate-binding protein